jgi:hypothetical protein
MCSWWLWIHLGGFQALKGLQWWGADEQEADAVLPHLRAESESPSRVAAHSLRQERPGVALLAPHLCAHSVKDGQQHALKDAAPEGLAEGAAVAAKGVEQHLGGACVAAARGMGVEKE